MTKRRMSKIRFTLLMIFISCGFLAIMAQTVFVRQLGFFNLIISGIGCVFVFSFFMFSLIGLYDPDKIPKGLRHCHETRGGMMFLYASPSLTMMVLQFIDFCRGGLSAKDIPLANASVAPFYAFSVVCIMFIHKDSKINNSHSAPIAFSSITKRAWFFYLCGSIFIFLCFIGIAIKTGAKREDLADAVFQFIVFLPVFLIAFIFGLFSERKKKDNLKHID